MGLAATGGPRVVWPLLAFWGLALAGTPAAAEVDVPLTLAEALAAADRRNPELLAARAKATAQEARAEAVERGRLPRLSVASSWSRTDNPSYVFSHKLDAGEFTAEDFDVARLNAPGSISHLMTTASLEASLDVFGKIKDAARSQAAASRAAAAAAGEAALEVRLRVTEAYRQAALAARAVEVQERALAGARSREADVEARVGEGAALNADLLRVRTRRRQREADLAEARGEARIAAATLARLLGAEPGTVYRPVDAPAAPAPLAADEPGWIERALRERPVLRAAAERVEALRRAARLEGRALLPDLGVYAQARDDRSAFSGGAQSYAVGVGLRWSVFDPARPRREAAAQAELRAAEHEARAALDQVRLEAAAAHRRAGAAHERWAAAAGGAEDGREALRVVQERRRAGLATLTDELETEAQSLQAELLELRAAAGAALADAALDRAAGVGATAAPDPGAAQ